jgi:hypothetical protein
MAQARKPRVFSAGQRSHLGAPADRATDLVEQGIRTTITASESRRQDSRRRRGENEQDANAHRVEHAAADA